MSDERFELRVAFGKHPRVRFYVASEARRHALGELANKLKRAKGVDYAFCVKTLQQAADATDDEFATFAAFATELAGGELERVEPETNEPRATGPTFEALARRWTSGELAREWPDYVKEKRSAGDDVNRFERLFKTIGNVPLARFALADAERAMAALPSDIASATRRQYAQLISKVLKLAVYPCKLLDRSPLPVGFLPKVKSKKATAFLYPNEEAQLLACTKVPLARRVLYGFLSREGLRLGEAARLRWRDVDLVRGVVTLDANKTDDPRAWAMSPGIKEALAAYRRANASADGLVFQTDLQRAALTFREDLQTAKVDRAELFSETKTRKQIRVHDLRATFVTLALANNRTEAWVQDRTGHKSSAMINKYRRQARQAVELKMGELGPLVDAIPELAKRETPPDPGQQPGQTTSRRGPPGLAGARSRIKSPAILRLRDRTRATTRLSKSVIRNNVSVQVRPSVPQHSR